MICCQSDSASVCLCILPIPRLFAHVTVFRIFGIPTAVGWTMLNRISYVSVSFFYYYYSFIQRIQTIQVDLLLFFFFILVFAFKNVHSNGRKTKFIVYFIVTIVERN